MKVLKSSDLTSPEGGSVTVVPDESDDLWVLYNLIDCDDLVTCGTSRKITKTDRAGGKGATEKRRLTLTVRATAASYDGLADCVRVSGTNASENEFVKMGAHHTLELGIRTRVTIAKHAWEPHQRDALARAADAAAAAEAAVLLLDAHSGAAKLYVLTAALVKTIGAADVAMPKGAKITATRGDKAVARFRAACLELLRKLDWASIKCVAVCGCGGAEFLSWLATNAPDRTPLRAAVRAGDRVCVAGKDVRDTSQKALFALLSDPTVKKRIADTSVARCCAALDAWEDARRADPDRVLCGSYDACAEAAERNAIDTLLVLDDVLKGSATNVAARRRAVALVEAAAAGGACVLPFSARHVAAEALRDLGGVAARLRYPCPDLQAIMDFSPDDDAATVVDGLPPAAAAADVAAVEIKRKAPPKPPPKKKAPPPKKSPPPVAREDADYDDGYDERWDGYDY